MASSLPPSGMTAGRTPGVVLLLALLVLAACAPARVAPDPERATAFAVRGEQLALDHNYAEAADQLVMASRYQPDDADRLLRAGEVLEAAGRWQEAADLYQEGLEHPQLLAAREPIAYRLALLQSSHLEEPARAEKQLALLAPGSVQAEDVRAMIELGRNQPRAALTRLQQALPHAADNNARGILSYHLALTYQRLGRQGDAARALFDAINLTRHRGTVEEIKRLWDEMNVR